MTPLYIMFFLLIFACSLLSIGFNFRDNNWGIAIMWVGAIIMLSTIGYKIYEVTHMTGG